MPTRILREGILSSPLVNSLTPEAELFYRRLMSVADDHGRYYAAPAILRANCYPLQLDRISEDHAKQMLSSCVAANLIVLYGEGAYLCIVKFNQQTRSRSKFPEPTANEMLSIRKANAKQMLSTCEASAKQMLSLVVGVGEGVGEDVAADVANFASRLGALYGRPENARWSYLEESTFAEIQRDRPDMKAELADLEAFKAKPDSFFPQSLGSLLQKWTETLDRARNYETRNRNRNRPNSNRNEGTFNANTDLAALESKVR